MIVADAPAEISGQGVFYFFPAGVRRFIQKCPGGHDHSRGAKAALECRVFYKCFLKRIQRARSSLLKPLDGGNVFSVAFHGERRAGDHCLSIHDDRASPAGALVAAGLCASEPQRLPEGMKQCVGWVDLVGSGADFQVNLLTIDCKPNLSVFMPGTGHVLFFHDILSTILEFDVPFNGGVGVGVFNFSNGNMSGGFFDDGAGVDPTDDGALNHFAAYFYGGGLFL